MSDGMLVSWRVEQRNEKGEITARASAPSKSLARGIAADWRRREPTQTVRIMRITTTTISRRWRVGGIPCLVRKEFCAWQWYVGRKGVSGSLQWQSSEKTYQDAIAAAEHMAKMRQTMKGR